MRIILFLLVTSLAYSQTAAGQTIVVKASRLFDGASETLISPAVIVIEGNRIKAVGSNIATPPGATVINLGDATLMPGFMDAKASLYFCVLNFCRFSSVSGVPLGKFHPVSLKISSSTGKPAFHNCCPITFIVCICTIGNFFDIT